MKINKSSIAGILNYHKIPSIYDPADQEGDAAFQIFGKYEGIEISFSRGLAMVAKFDSQGNLWDLMVNDSDKLFCAIVEISMK